MSQVESPSKPGKKVLPKNFVQLSGKVGSDPVLKTFKSGNKVVRFTLAVDEPSEDGKQRSMSIGVESWDDKASVVMERLKKGNDVTIKGRLTIKSFEKKVGDQTVQMTQPVIRLNAVLLAKKAIDKKIQDDVHKNLFADLDSLSEETEEEMAGTKGGSIWGSISGFFHGDDDHTIDSAFSSAGTAIVNTLNDTAISMAGGVGTPTGTAAEQTAGEIMGEIFHVAEAADE